MAMSILPYSVRFYMEVLISAALYGTCMSLDDFPVGGGVEKTAANRLAISPYENQQINHKNKNI